METEKRMIDANVVTDHLTRCIEQSKGLMRSVCVAIKCFVEQIPTEDAAKIVNGYTIISEEPKEVMLDRQCGLCHNLMLATDNFCPMCGARNCGERIG